MDRFFVFVPPGGDEAPVAVAGKHNVNFTKICIINNPDGKGRKRGVGKNLTVGTWAGCIRHDGCGTWRDPSSSYMTAIPGMYTARKARGV